MSTDVKRAAVGELEIAYETFGDPSDPAALLVMGLGTQMLAWPDQLCEDIAATGRYVVRFDNRDVGLSTHLDHLPAPQPGRVLLRVEKAPYSIGDMARDALGLMDALGLDTVDVVGASMGGFISQSMAIQAPERLRSLTLIMTSTGSRRVGRPAPRIARDLLRRRRMRTRDEAVAAAVEVFKLIGSPGFALDEAYLERRAAESYDRGYDPSGYLRQLAAVLTQPDRTRKLRKLDVPTLVIHGLNDPLVSPTGGLALARTIPGAKFVGFAGMGHDLPRALWQPIADEIAAVVRTAERV
ncbi:MAG TPA: alpha/beta hydrolase [Mycobacteriales bacterium]|nr:alpha/beta hydrolase [Mycobacteriales bacterium]